MLKRLRFLKKTRKTNIFFNTGPYGDPLLKIKISKIGLRHVLSWPKLDLKPKCHDPGTLENMNKVLSDIQRVFNTGPYGDTLENQNFEKRFSAC